ncbi:RDD family protein [Corynebacterium epidermidicanis]|nr:RDD family protein [Corynebacterium epidermidicanis]
MSEQKRSWLEGPMIPGDADDPMAPGRWPGEKLGLPEKGAGALASVMRRAVGITIDWFLCMFIAIIIRNFTDALGGVSTLTLILFCLISVVSVWLFARTPGQAILGMGVARVDAVGRVGFVRALVRTVLTVFIFPPIMVDADGRGLHDRATQTAVIFG